MERLKKYTELTKKVFLSKRISKAKLKDLKTKYKKVLKANSIYQGEKLTYLRKIDNLSKSNEELQKQNEKLKSELAISKKESQLGRELIDRLENFFFKMTQSKMAKTGQ